MSENEDEFDDDGNSTAKPAGDPNGPKALRDQLKKVQKEKDDLLTEVTTFRRNQTTSTIEQALEEHGAPKKLARLVAVDVTDPSPDAVRQWLEANGGDFGWSADTSDADDADMQEAARINRATTSAPNRQDKPITPEYIKNAPREELIRRGIL